MPPLCGSCSRHSFDYTVDIFGYSGSLWRHKVTNTLPTITQRRDLKLHFTYYDLIMLYHPCPMFIYAYVSLLCVEFVNSLVQITVFAQW